MAGGDALGWPLGNDLGESLEALVGTRLGRLMGVALGWPLGDPLGGSLQALVGTRLGLLLSDALD